MVAQGPVKSKLEAGLAWARETPAKKSDLDGFEADVRARWEREHGEPLE